MDVVVAGELTADAAVAGDVEPDHLLERVGDHQDLVAAAEADGLDLVGVQDHPYAPALVDTFALMPYLLAHTSRIKVFPDVAALPLRPAAMLAQTSASLDVVSGGRFELGLGAGGNWAGIESMGAVRLTVGMPWTPLTEAISVLRALWQPGEARVPGEYHSVAGVRTGPGPAHPINIWIGAQGPRSLGLTGRLGDGWAAPIPSYLPYEEWPKANRTIDEAARAAGRGHALRPRGGPRRPRPTRITRRVPRSDRASPPPATRDLPVRDPVLGFTNRQLARRERGTRGC